VNRILNAIADPTRRRILHALKEHGGCSIDKDVRLVRLGYRAAHSAFPTHGFASHGDAQQGGIGGREENWPVEMVSAE